MRLLHQIQPSLNLPFLKNRKALGFIVAWNTLNTNIDLGYSVVSHRFYYRHQDSDWRPAYNGIVDEWHSFYREYFIPSKFEVSMIKVLDFA